MLPTIDPFAALQSAPAQIDFAATVQSYLLHGIVHILTGYDHLLFVSALVLAAPTLWEIIKVVSAFTLAHTITLVLAVLHVINLPAGIVEPMIAASIVFVAVENLIWPQRSSGWPRMAVAFGFGLFHGLGFAGGLLDAMAGLPTSGMLTALASFSVGVEIGHQSVVIPLFLLMYWLRRQPMPRLAPGAVQAGSCLISLAGAYYLLLDLHNANLF